jgi:hypothetical protein
MQAPRLVVRGMFVSAGLPDAFCSITARCVLFDHDIVFAFVSVDIEFLRYSGKLTSTAAPDVIVISAGVPDRSNVTAVRYAWHNIPDMTVYNSGDLPLVPFEVPVDPTQVGVWVASRRHCHHCPV